MDNNATKNATATIETIIGFRIGEESYQTTSSHHAF